MGNDVIYNKVEIIERDGKHVHVNTSDSICPKCEYNLYSAE
ncbi:hypothetical protein [Clostridium bowmanii]|nr:hypothetical protein [Clostridium bowmanii]